MTVTRMDQPRPVVAAVVIDGRTYRGKGNLIESTGAHDSVAVLTLTPAPAPAPVRSRPTTDAEEVLS